MRVLLVSLAVVVCAVSFLELGKAQPSDSVTTLTGQSWAFAITVPAGWILEDGHGTWSGARAILFPAVAPQYPKVMWGNPDAWITVGIASKQSEGALTLNILRAFYGRVDSQGVKSVSDLPNLVTRDGKKALLRRNVGSGSFGARAFIEDHTIVAVFELNRFDEQQFNEAYPKFEQLVQSYRSMPVTNKAGK